jgi:hypothetical protein
VNPHATAMVASLSRVDVIIRFARSIRRAET